MESSYTGAECDVFAECDADAGVTHETGSPAVEENVSIRPGFSLIRCMNIYYVIISYGVIP